MLARVTAPNRRSAVPYYRASRDSWLNDRCLPGSSHCAGAAPRGRVGSATVRRVLRALRVDACGISDKVRPLSVNRCVGEEQQKNAIFDICSKHCIRSQDTVYLAKCRGDADLFFWGRSNERSVGGNIKLKSASPEQLPRK